jgi:hypothetical protein
MSLPMIPSENGSSDPKCCVLSSRLLRRWVMIPLAAVAVGAAGYRLTAAEGQKVPDQVSHGHWTIHDMSRPKPPVITPGTFSTQEQPGTPPSDAVVLFDGKDLSKWTSGGKEPAWKVENGYFEVTPGKGEMDTKDAIGDCQLHVEWAAPVPVKGDSQGRGNSGCYIMGQYEVQVLDTFNNNTYADGGATAIYGQNPPLVNACRKPGEWQVYDIIWRGPRWDKDGKIAREATVTVLHNGVLTQDHYRLTGPSGHYMQPPYKQHPEKLPLHLQNHGNPVRYRNIWYRPLQNLGERNNVVDWTEGDAKPAAATDSKTEKK